MPAVLKGLFALPNVPDQTSPTDADATAKNTTEAPPSSSRGDRFLQRGARDQALSRLARSHYEGLLQGFDQGKVEGVDNFLSSN